MKYAIIGSRNFNDYNLIKNELSSYNNITEIISGGAIGVDSLAKKYANENNIEIIEFFPNWKKYGKSAGVIRNKLIIENCDIVIAFWDGLSKGTKSSINIANKLNKNLKIVLTD